jgi:hypothetical protein
MAVQPTRLCIISRGPLRSGHFIATLQASLGSEDPLEIIMDRRRGRSSGESDLKEDRRRQHQVALALEANGFAIVPASVDPPEYRPIEQSSPVDDYFAERLESIRSSHRRRPGTLTPRLLWILSGVTLGALVLLLVGEPDRPPGQIDESLDRTPPSIASRDTNSPPQAGIDQGVREARPELDATARRSPSAPPPSNQVAGVLQARASTSKATSTQVVGSRAKLVRKPVSQGWGDSYAVRLLDREGQPMLGANVRLVALMANGTVENIAMGALSEPGTYRGTVPTNRSTPIDLRVRVATGDGFVEVPVTP